MNTKKTKPVEIDFNPEFTHALELMNESGKTLLITGRTGTGKSGLLNFFRNHPKNVRGSGTCHRHVLQTRDQNLDHSIS